MPSGLTGYEAVREDGEHGYTFMVSGRRPEIHRRLTRLLDRLRESGEIEETARRYLG